MQDADRIHLEPLPQAYTYYMAESGEWLVRALHHHPHVRALIGESVSNQ